MKIQNHKTLRILIFFLLVLFYSFSVEGANILKLVSSSDSAGLNTLDKYALPGDTCELELWVEIDTNVNGIAYYLSYDASSSDLGDSAFEQDYTEFGDTPLVNTLFDYSGISDTMNYAVLTLADSLAAGSSTRVAIIKIVTPLTEDTVTIGFDFDYALNRQSMICSVYCTDVITGVDSGIIVVDATPPVDTFTLTSPIAGEENDTGSINFSWQDTFDTASGLAYYVIQFDTDFSDSFNPALYEYITPDTTSNYTPGLSFTTDTWLWRVAAVDNVGNTSSWTDPETFVARPPIEAEIFIETPAISIATNDTPFEVTGYTSGTNSGDTVRIWVNNINQDTFYLYTASGTYSFSIALDSGWDTIIVDLTDTTGTVISTAEVTVEFNDSVSITIDTPTVSGGSYDTNTITLIIAGHADDVEDGDTVLLMTNSIEQDTLNILNGNWSGTAIIGNKGDSITVKITDRFGNTAYDTITLNYYDTCSVEITSPDYISYDTNSTEIIVSGTINNARDGDTVIIYTNGAANTTVIISSNTFSGTAVLTGLGDSISIELNNLFGELLYDTITINYFDTPSAKITSPDSTTYDTSYSEVTISGTTINTQSGDTVAIYTNGILNSIVNITTLNGSFSGTAALSSYGDSILICINDTYGRQFYDTITINYFGSPIAEITYPDTVTHDTNVSIITISGTTKNTQAGDTIVIYTNSTENTTTIITAIDGSFSGTALVNSYSESIVICVNDAYGRQFYDTILINYFDTPIAEITYPDTDIHDTVVSEITISGTSINTHAGDTVAIYTNGTLNSISILSSTDGDFNGTAALTGFSDSILICINDTYGRVYYDTLIVNYFESASLEITYPDTNVHDTNISIITISGTTYSTLSNDTIIIYTNGTANTTVVLTAANGTFSGTALVSSIGDTIIAELHTSFGSTSYDTIIINYYEAPELEITYPDYSYHDTDVSIIVVSGTTTAADSSDIYIYNNGILQSQTTASGNLWSGTTLLYTSDSVSVQVIDMFSAEGWDTISVIYSWLVSCTVTIQGRSNHFGSTVTIYNGTDTYQATSDTNGYCTVCVVTGGIYDIELKESRTLALRFTGITINSDTDMGILGQLLAGDADNNNRINPIDASIVKNGQSFGYRIDADIDNDGDNDSTDLYWIRQNFGLIGE